VAEQELVDRLRAAFSGRYWGLVGIETVSAEPGRATGRIALQEHHLNYNDVVHGGVISSLVDSAAGLAVRSVRSWDDIAERPHATSDLHVTYLAPARGTELVAEARIIRAGRTAIYTEVHVCDDQGREVARGLVTFVIAAGRSTPAGE